MKISAIALLLLLTISLVHADLTFSSFNGDFSSTDGTIGATPLSDIITVANYYGCKTWNKNLCTECSEGYYFNKIGVCCEIGPLCSKFNRAEGVCEACYQGYSIVNCTCSLATQDVGCALWNGNTCVKCSKKWYFNNQGSCSPISDQCYTWNDDGNCLTCYGGYVLSNGVCVINPSPFSSANNVLCATWSGESCIACAQRAYFDQFRICQAVSSQCQTWDAKDGFCLSCYAGYDLSNGKCALSSSTTAHPSDIGCSLWNSKQSICLQCSNRWFFNSQQVCAPVSDQCNSFDKNTGLCTSCFGGYDLTTSGSCVVSNTNNQPSDVGCGTWDWKNQKCLQCSDNWVANSFGVCVPVSDQCKTFYSSGSCASCYAGYNLDNGKCVAAPIQKVADVGCATWDWKNQKCLQCSTNWVANNAGVCVPVSDQCSKWDSNGLCTLCYVGYNLVSGSCVAAPVEHVSDVGCATWDWKNKKCLQCSDNWVSNSNGVCVPVSDQCKSFDQTGACGSCYVGYNLINGKCVLAPIQHVSDVGCATWDWKNQKCLQCSDNWISNSNGVCVPVSDQCKSFDQSGACGSCYVGYNLIDGKCVAAPIEQVSDVGCALWDWNNKKCLQCSDNWVSNNGVCVPVSDQCKSFDQTGACVSCYVGYNLSNGKCILAPIGQVSDVGCATWDWKNQKCLKCSNNWVSNDFGVCIPVSDQCKTFDQTGACSSCYVGYNLASNGKCVLAPIQQVSDVGCGTWDWNNQVCLKCSVRYVFNANHVCVPVADSCNSFDNNGVCTSCYVGFVLNNGSCQQGNSLCKSSDSNGACNECYSGYVLNNGNCVPISKLANLALYYSQCCPQRLAALSASVGGLASP